MTSENENKINLTNRTDWKTYYIGRKQDAFVNLGTQNGVQSPRTKKRSIKRKSHRKEREVGQLGTANQLLFIIIEPDSSQKIKHQMRKIIIIIIGLSTI